MIERERNVAGQLSQQRHLLAVEEPGCFRMQDEHAYGLPIDRERECGQRPRTGLDDHRSLRPLQIFLDIVRTTGCISMIARATTRCPSTVFAVNLARRSSRNEPAAPCPAANRTACSILRYDPNPRLWKLSDFDRNAACFTEQSHRGLCARTMSMLIPLSTACTRFEASYLELGVLLRGYVLESIEPASTALLIVETLRGAAP